MMALFNDRGLEQEGEGYLEDKDRDIAKDRDRIMEHDRIEEDGGAGQDRIGD